MWQEEEQKASHLPCFLTSETTKLHGHTQYNEAPVFNEHEAPFNFFGSSVSSPVLLVRDMPAERHCHSLWHVHLCLVEKDPEKEFRGDEK